MPEKKHPPRGFDAREMRLWGERLDKERSCFTKNKTKLCQSLHSAAFSALRGTRSRDDLRRLLDKQKHVGKQSNEDDFNSFRSQKLKAFIDGDLRRSKSSVACTVKGASEHVPFEKAFPNQHKPLINTRPELVRGQMPKLRFKLDQLDADWIPATDYGAPLGKYVQPVPEFYLSRGNFHAEEVFSLFRPQNGLESASQESSKGQTENHEFNGIYGTFQRTRLSDLI